MVTSGTYDFRPDVEELISEAFERVGIDPQALTGYQAKTARRSLNLTFNDLSNRGINYWALKNTELVLTPGQVKYTLPKGTIELLDVALREQSSNGPFDTAMLQLSIADYNVLPNKNIAGRPHLWFFDRKYTPELYLYQPPNRADYSVLYWAVHQIEDITGSAQDANIPYRVTDCACAGLAARLALKLAPDRYEILAQDYERTFALLEKADNEGVTISIEPANLMG